MSNERATRALTRLREQGRRVTTARRMVLEGLGQTDEHVTADILARWIQHIHPEIHLSTVYRTLDSLCEWGLIVQIRRTHGAAFFHLAPTHQHVMCEVCGRIEDIPASAFDDLAERLRDIMASSSTSSTPRSSAGVASTPASKATEAVVQRDARRSSRRAVAGEGRVREECGDEIGQVTGEQLVVASRWLDRAAGKLDEREPERREAEAQHALFFRQCFVREVVPAPDAAASVLARHELDARPRPRVHLAVDLQVIAAAVGIGELRGERQHQRGGQRMQVVKAFRLVLVEQHVPAGLGVGAVLVDDRAESALRSPKWYCSELLFRWPAARLISRSETLSMPRSANNRSAAPMSCARVSTRAATSVTNGSLVERSRRR